MREAETCLCAEKQELIEKVTFFAILLDLGKGRIAQLLREGHNQILPSLNPLYTSELQTINLLQALSSYFISSTKINSLLRPEGWTTHSTTLRDSSLPTVLHRPAHH